MSRHITAIGRHALQAVADDRGHTIHPDTRQQLLDHGWAVQNQHWLRLTPIGEAALDQANRDAT